MIGLNKADILDLHHQLSETFGGNEAIRAERLLDGAMAAVERSQKEKDDLAVWAAAIAYHMTMRRAFVEGNSRLAAAAAEWLVLRNEGQLLATDAELVELFTRLAAGELTSRAVERAYAGWVKSPPAGPRQDLDSNSPAMTETVRDAVNPPDAGGKETAGSRSEGTEGK